MRGENFYRNFFRLMNEHFVDIKFLAVISNVESALTRFANSRIHQNVFERKNNVSVLATKDNKVAIATSNDLTTSGLRSIKEKLQGMLESSTPLDYQFKLPSQR